MRYLKTILEELDVRYTMPVQPVILPPGLPGVRTPTMPSLGPLPMNLGRQQHLSATFSGNAERAQGAMSTFDRFA